MEVKPETTREKLAITCAYGVAVLLLIAAAMMLAKQLEQSEKRALNERLSSIESIGNTVDIQRQKGDHSLGERLQNLQDLAEDDHKFLADINARLESLERNQLSTPQGTVLLYNPESGRWEAQRPE